jgi:diadenosine tetraphosphate (Ap4A) HIT family hydrolase
MALIYETENFLIETPESPHIDRTDGGHIVITPKIKVVDRTKIAPDLAKELMKLSVVTGEAMATVMNAHGVDIGRINYQDNGNWSVFSPGGPHMHLHLYGRAKSAKVQKYGDALNFPHRDTGFYDGNKPLTSVDVKAIRTYLIELLSDTKYINF